MTPELSPEQHKVLQACSEQLKIISERLMAMYPSLADDGYTTVSANLEEAAGSCDEAVIFIARAQRRA